MCTHPYRTYTSTQPAPISPLKHPSKVPVSRPINRTTTTNINVALQVSGSRVLTLALSAETIHKRQGKVTYRLKTLAGSRGRKHVV